MPEDDLTQTDLPEIPAIKSNDEIPATDAPVENSLAEKIRAAGGAILEKAGIKRRRGRPKNCDKCGLPETKCGCAGLAGKSDSPAAEITLENNNPADLPKIIVSDPAVADSDLDKKINALFRKCVAAGPKGLVTGCEAVTKMLANRAGVDEAFTEKTLAAAKPEPDAIDNLSEAIILIMEENNFKIKKGGAWYCAGLAAARISGPYALSWLEFRKEIQRKAKLAQGDGK